MFIHGTDGKLSLGARDKFNDITYNGKILEKVFIFSVINGHFNLLLLFLSAL